MPFTRDLTVPFYETAYQGYAMREVSLNSTFLYETSTHKSKGFDCLFIHNSLKYCFWLKKLILFSHIEMLMKFLHQIYCEMSHLSKLCQPIVVRVNGAVNLANGPYLLLSSGCCTNTDTRMKGGHWPVAVCSYNLLAHDDIIIWKHFPHYWPFVWGIHHSLVNSPHKGQWCGALMFSLIYAWTNSWTNNRDAGDLRCHRAHYDVTVMIWPQAAYS